MSQHQAFRRMPAQPQVAQKLESMSFPAPSRGIIQNESEAYMQPGAALICDNWKPTLKGASLRGGCELWCDLHPGISTFTSWDPATIANVTLSGGNLVATNTGTTSANQGARIATGKTTGKYYFECTFTTSATSPNMGISIATTSSTFTGIGTDGTTGVILKQGGNVYTVGTLSGVGFSGMVAGSVACIAIDLDNRLIWFRKNAGGTWNSNVSYNPSTGIGGIPVPPGTMAPFVTFGGSGGTSGNILTANFGATAFAGAVPAGFTSGWSDIAPPPPLTDTTTRKPVISMFEYRSGVNHKMFAANATTLYDVTTTTPVLVKAGQTSGNYAASQLANAGGDWLTVVNDAGDFPLQFNGTTWTTLSAGQINASLVTYPGNNVSTGQNLVYVCKYRNRYFFIEANSMNAWYLPLNAVQGTLNMIPMSGAATKGGKLLACFSWSIDAGDGIDDKIVFLTDLGEAIIFTGGDPSSAANWRQEGRYNLSPPMGMNAHLAIGGDVLIATVDGILPITGAITKDRAELELAAITRQIKIMWRDEVLEKREHPWTMCKWDEYGGIFCAVPGSAVGKERVLAVNAATGAWARFTGWDCSCFARMRGDMFFGTQNGRIMQADRTGYDDGVPYVATLVGGWEVFQSPSQTITWRQARASFSARAGEPFQPQLSAITDYIVSLPPAPSAGPDPGTLDLWDEGIWDTALWDSGVPPTPVVRTTGWVSVGKTGFSHAPVVQVMVAQNAKPQVDLISIAATFERCGINV